MPHSMRSSASRPRKPSSPSADVSYSHSKRLSIPGESSSASTWARFSSEVGILLLGGYSIAQAVGVDLDASISSAGQLAEPMMTRVELEQYTKWRKGKPVPPVDWRRFSTPLNGNTSPQRARWNDLTDALRVLYDDDTVSRENCKAWVEKYTDMMPLLIACKKVELVRDDSKLGRGSSKARRDVHEIVGCRLIIAEIGKQRVRSNTWLKQLNKDSASREVDLLERLERVNISEPRDREDVAGQFAAREQYYGKLTKVRVDRLEKAADIGRQNVEMLTAEKLIKGRMNVLMNRLGHGK